MTVRRIQSKSTEFVCSSSTVRCRWPGTALDGQTYSVKKYRIRLSVVNPSAVAFARSSWREPLSNYKFTIHPETFFKLNILHSSLFTLHDDCRFAIIGTRIAIRGNLELRCSKYNTFPTSSESGSKKSRELFNRRRAKTKSSRILSRRLRRR